MRNLILLVVFFLLSACEISAWNNPYPSHQSEQNIYYSYFSERPKHLDPVSSYSANEYRFIAGIYEPPLQYHFLKRPYELIPLTATELPQLISSDHQDSTVIYRIEIKPNILYQPHPAFARDKQGQYLYHNLTVQQVSGFKKISDFSTTGTRQLIAADYVHQIKRMVDPRVYSPIAGVMENYIVGLTDLKETLTTHHQQNEDQQIDLRNFNLSGVRIINDYVFEITLKQVYPQFIYWLTMPFFAPMPWEAEYFYNQEGMVDNNITLNWYPIGTGPYMLVENNPNRRMVLQRNPNFHDEYYPSTGENEDDIFLQDAGKKIPFIDTAIFNLEKESIPTWNKFLQGYYDASGIGSDNFDQAVQFDIQSGFELSEALKQKGIALDTAVTTSVYYMGFNMLDDVVGGDSQRARLLRHAISIAIDYEEYITIFNNGRGQIAHSPLPPGIFGHETGEAGMNSYVYEWQKGKAIRRDIEQARSLMKEAGYANGIDPNTQQPLILYYDTVVSGASSRAVFDWLRKQFSKLGVNLLIRATDYNRFQDKMLTGNAQIFQWGWNADYPDPENFFFLLYGGNGKAKYKGENAANYDNAKFNLLFEKMKVMQNNEQRQALIKDIIDILQYDAPWVWGFYPVSYTLHHRWYHNAKPNLISNNTLKYKRIDPLLRMKLRANWNKPKIMPILWVLLFGIIFGVIYSYRSKSKSR